MKKLLSLLLLLSSFGPIFAQTILNRFPIELKKSSDYFQIINAENNRNEYFTFITDKEKVTVLKYNAALFLKDSMSVERPDKALDFMAGATFSADGNPNLYWTSKNYETIQFTHFDFENRTTSNLTYENDFKREKVIDAFVAQNTFNVVSITSFNKLKFTTFSNSGKSEHTATKNAENVPETTDLDTKNTELISDYGVTKIESNTFTPLYVSVTKVKRYLLEDHYVLSIDGTTSTQLFTFSLTNFEMKKEVFPYKIMENAESNSFLHEGFLYQITADSKVLYITNIDLKTQNTVETYEAIADKEIDFKNSPLLIQSESGKTREVKKTAKFLSKLDDTSIGLNIYATPNYNLFTIGGVRSVASSGNVALGVGIILGGIIGGEVIAPTDFFENGNLQSLYFESFFDTSFKPVKLPFRPLYVDALGGFLASNRISVLNIQPYKNFVILNYYDSKTKEFVMRRFEDIVE